MAPSEPEYVDRGIVISVQLSATFATMPAFAEFLLADRPTAATHLAGIPGIHK
jgi:hypothetical protein